MGDLQEYVLCVGLSLWPMMASNSYVGDLQEYILCVGLSLCCINCEVHLTFPPWLENFENSFSHIAKNTFKFSTFVGGNFKISLSPMAKNAYKIVHHGTSHGI